MNVMVNSVQKNADGSFTLAGTSLANAMITVTANGSQLRSTTADATGNWQITLPAGTPDNVTVTGAGRSEDVALMGLNLPSGRATPLAQ